MKYSINILKLLNCLNKTLNNLSTDEQDKLLVELKERLNLSIYKVG